jgi:hypothetical protein
MTKLRLGFFREFKGGDIVLLDGEPESFKHLSALLGEFAASTEPRLSIHSVSAVSLRHPVQLFASRTCHNVGAQFCWLCSAAEISTVQGMLESLSGCGTGHQYFNLIGSSTQLMVSVGEYGESWWGRHG